MNIPQLTIEMEDDGTVLLEQEWCGESDRIHLHPIHIRYLAELAGLVPSLRTAHNSAEPQITAGAATAHDAAAAALAHTYFTAP